MDAKNPAGWLVELSCLSEMVYKENITCPRVDTNFTFECSTREDKIRVHNRALDILFIIQTPMKYQENDFLD